MERTRAGCVGWRLGRAGPPASLSSGVKAQNQVFCNLPPQLPLYTLNENGTNIEDPDFDLMSPSRYLAPLLALVLGLFFPTRCVFALGEPAPPPLSVKLSQTSVTCSWPVPNPAFA